MQNDFRNTFCKIRLLVSDPIRYLVSSTLNPKLQTLYSNDCHENHSNLSNIDETGSKFRCLQLFPKPNTLNPNPHTPGSAPQTHKEATHAPSPPPPFPPPPLPPLHPRPQSPPASRPNPRPPPQPRHWRRHPPRPRKRPPRRRRSCLWRRRPLPRARGRLTLERYPNPSGKCSHEWLKRGTVTGTMGRAAHPSAAGALGAFDVGKVLICKEN